MYHRVHVTRALIDVCHVTLNCISGRAAAQLKFSVYARQLGRAARHDAVVVRNIFNIYPPAIIALH